jgi:hypothetical protein
MNLVSSTRQSLLVTFVEANRGGVPVTKVWSELSATNDCFDGSLFHAVVVSFVEGGMDVS